MFRFLLCCTLALSAPASAQPLLAGQDAERLADRALEPLAKSLAAYFDARAATVGLDKARVALETTLAELAKQLEGADPLRRVEDLQRAVWLSRRYSDKGLKAGRVSEESFQPGGFRGAPMKFAYRLPSDYAPAARAYPLLLAIPDAGLDPAQHLRTSWSSRALQDGAIVVVPQMPAEQGEWDQVIVRGRPGGLCHVLTALRIASERFAVDPDRIYVAGYGKGVPAAIGAGNYAPHRFAGVIGRAGDASEQGPQNFSNLPTFFAGGGARATAFRDAARAAGFDNCRVEPLAKEEDLWSWMLAHPRDAFPSEVTIVVGTPFPTRAYWLRLASAATDTRATARIDREANSVRIEGHGASHATLFLNDALVDLDRPLRVICNGVEVEAAVSRRLVSALNLLADGTSDPACVYVAQWTLSISAPASSLPGGDASRADLDFDQRLARAGDETELLWELYEWCGATQRAEKGARVLQRLLRIDPEHERARGALGHRRNDVQWFSSQEELERFQRRQDPSVAEALGYVQNRGLWMHPDERALANKGLVKNWETGQWLSPAEWRQLAAGWVRQDLSWISPEQAARVDQGLWLVDGEWLPLGQANWRRARIDSMWRIPSADVRLHATVDREVAQRALHEMSRAIPELMRAFGAAPAFPLQVVVLRDEEEYDRFAFGDPDGRRPATQAERLQVIHSAYFAESWFERVEGQLEHRGMGVSYWDSLAPSGDLYGVHSARLAVGLSYADAIDPSPKAVRKALTRGVSADFHTEYVAEKQLPAWLRYGGAVYAERYFEDHRVPADGNPWWTRKWSLDNLRARGGLRPLEEVFAFRLDPDDRDDALKLLIEAGLLVAFALDGNCPPVRDAHAELKRALAAGRLRASHLRALSDALIAHEPALRAFGEL